MFTYKEMLVEYTVWFNRAFDAHVLKDFSNKTVKTSNHIFPPMCMFGSSFKFCMEWLTYKRHENYYQNQNDNKSTEVQKNEENSE